jgi:hypothetical protein
MQNFLHQRVKKHRHVEWQMDSSFELWCLNHNVSPYLLSPREIKRVLSLFERLDTNGDGVLSVLEITEALVKFKVVETFAEASRTVVRLDVEGQLTRSGQILPRQLLEAAFIHKDRTLDFVDRLFEGIDAANQANATKACKTATSTSVTVSPLSDITNGASSLLPRVGRRISVIM